MPYINFDNISTRFQNHSIFSFGYSQKMPMRSYNAMCYGDNWHGKNYYGGNRLITFQDNLGMFYKPTIPFEGYIIYAYQDNRKNETISRYIPYTDDFFLPKTAAEFDAFHSQETLHPGEIEDLL